MEPFRYPVPPLYFVADPSAQGMRDHEQAIQLSQRDLVEIRRVQVDEMLDYLVTWLLPTLERLGVAEAGATLDGLCEMPSSAIDPLNPKSVLATYLRSGAMNLRSVKLRGDSGSPFADLDLDLVFLAKQQLACVAGLAAACDSQQRKTVHYGAAGRRKLGDTTREKVRREALAFALGKSRAQAAPDIAEKLEISPGRVLRLLSELFPGASWEARRSTDQPMQRDDSTDGSRRKR